jgi:phosphoribosylformimino-5-aminoimidazole carboxamide ribonucleotide (ProFAR) isomerase
MSFEVMPAIDVADGKLVRMSIGGPSVVGAFGADPIAAAEAYVQAGARWLHVVDVDLALTGDPSNVDVVTAIHERFPGVSVQASGGLVRPSDLERYLDAGAMRAVLGSAALADRASTASLIDTYREALVVGLETLGRRIRPRGRHDAIDLDLGETLEWLAEVRMARCLHTSVRRVGALSGPDLPGLRTVMDVGCPVIAAGGIASDADLAAVRDAGAEGAVVGRAALEGDIDLRAAFRNPA